MTTVRPTHTQFPDIFLDFYMAELSDAEWRCLCYITRHTLGYKKENDTDAISFNQFLKGITKADGTCVDKGTGLKSSASVAAGLAGLERRNLIVRTLNSSAKRGKEASAYTLVMEGLPGQLQPAASAQQSAPLLHLVNDPTLVTKVDPTSPTEEPLLQQVKIQERTYQQTTLQKTTSKNGADKPRGRCSAPAKSPLRNAKPQLAADRDACVAHWETVTGKRKNGGTYATVAGLLKDYSAADITGTIDALWRDAFWHQGNMSWAAIGDRVKAFKDGALSHRPTSKPKGLNFVGTGPTAKDLAADRADVPPDCAICGCINGTHDRAAHERYAAAQGGAS